MPRIAIPIFPGTNCEQDAAHAVNILGGKADLVYHTQTDLSLYDGVIVPGGFAHGDYLRTGAIARFSPIMSSIEEFAKQGKPVLGICNGFQILCEAHLLPGALQKNAGMKFLCEEVELEVVNNDSPLTNLKQVGDKIHIPINHFEGNYTCSDETYDELVANNQIVLRYTNNPNGSRDSIAGICNKQRNVVGLMPHPERASEKILGNDDGALLMRSFINACSIKKFVAAV
ncbi:MAG: phosphoribosylformylglycinamidine synthase subunit PurQ [Acidimicrobiia bacterium]